MAHYSRQQLDLMRESLVYLEEGWEIQFTCRYCRQMIVGYDRREGWNEPRARRAAETEIIEHLRRPRECTRKPPELRTTRGGKP